MGEKKTDGAYLIWNLDLSKEVAIISMSSGDAQCQIRKPLKVLLVMNQERELPKQVFTDRVLNTSVGRKLITASLDANDNTVKTDKLKYIIEVVLSLDELDNTDNLEDRRLSSISLRHHVTGSESLRALN